MTKAHSRLAPSLSKQSDPAAGNGVLSRRIFLEGALVTSAACAGASNASAEPLAVQNWMKEPGAGFAPYGQPSHFEDKVVRAILSPPNPPLPGIGTARTPLHLRRSIITPSGLHSSAAIPVFPTSIANGTDWRFLDELKRELKM